ncbi:MAG: tetratricopeptide repeat protein, partial [Phormidesmis sp.]
MLPFWAVFTAFPPALEINAEIGASRSKRAIDSTVLDLITAGRDQIDQGDYAAAISSFQSARSLIAGSNNTDVEGEILLGLGDAYFYSQQYAEAIPVLEAAIALYSPTPVPDLETAADYIDILIDLSIWLAYSHQSLSHFGSALTYYQQLSGPTVTARLPSDRLAALLTNKGTVEAEIGQYETATTTLQQA